MPSYYEDKEAERLKRYTCFYCGKISVVPDLARSCEEKHEERDDI